MAYNTFGRLKVRKAGSNDEPLILTFIDEKVMSAVHAQCLSEGFEIIDASAGYKLFRNENDAMETVRIFCR